MLKKDLLIVYNTFGGTNDATSYLKDLELIFWHINENNLNVDIVVSSVLNQDACIEKIKQVYQDKIKIVRYDYQWPVQVTFNKTVLIMDSTNEYEGYLYISSGVELPKINDLFIRLIKRNNSGEYGIIQLLIDEDSGLGSLRDRFRNWDSIKHENRDNDFLITIGDYCNFHIGLFNRKMKEFYGKPMLDVYGICGMEGGITYTSYALRLKNIILNDSMCHHRASSDRTFPENLFDNSQLQIIPCGLNWGRTNDIFLNDKEGIDAGLGNYPGPYWGLPEVVLKHREDKYDENYLSIDERLKDAVKRCYFTNNNELDYEKINYIII